VLHGRPVGAAELRRAVRKHRFGFLQVLDDLIVDLGRRLTVRGRRLGPEGQRRRRGGKRNVAEGAHQREEVERTEELGLGDPNVLRGVGHVGRLRQLDDGVGGVDSLIEITPGVTNEVDITVELGGVVVEELVAAVGALGVLVGAEHGHR
jgi:hypothetical protein